MQRCAAATNTIADLDSLPNLSPAFDTIADVTLESSDVLYIATPPWKLAKSITPTELSEDNLKDLLHPQELLAAQWIGVTCLKDLVMKRKSLLCYAHFLVKNPEKAVVYRHFRLASCSVDRYLLKYMYNEFQLFGWLGHSFRGWFISAYNKLNA